jgi:hypothetical protein
MEETTQKTIELLGQIFGATPEEGEIYDFVCGEDFCESCGDCMACDGEFPCSASKDGQHTLSIDLLEKRKRKKVM